MANAISPSVAPVAWVAVEKITQQVLWLVLFLILAPKLGPAPYGLLSLTMVIVGFCELVLTESAGEALLTVKTATRGHVGTANICSLAAGVGAAALICILAKPFALMFHAPELFLMFLALAPLPVLSALISSPVAMLKREARFRPLAVRSALGLSLGGVCGIAAALAGAGVWALVIQVVVQRAAELLILWAAVRELPAFTWSTQCFRDLKDCAGNVFFARSMSWCAGQAPRLVLGWFLGPAGLGLFTLAQRLTDVLLQILLVPATTVARLEMRHYHASHLGLNAAFKTLLLDVGSIAFPACVGLAAITPALLHAGLGQRWLGAAVPTQLTILTVAPWTYFYCATAVTMGVNLSRLEAQIQAMLGVTALLVVLVCSQWGLATVCASLLVRLTLLAVALLFVLKRYAKVDPLELLIAPLGPAVGACIMGAAVTFAGPFLAPVAGRYLLLPGLVVVGASVYAVSLCVFAPKELRRLATLLVQRGAPT